LTSLLRVVIEAARLVARLGRVEGKRVHKVCLDHHEDLRFGEDFQTCDQDIKAFLTSRLHIYLGKNIATLLVQRLSPVHPLIFDRLLDQVVHAHLLLAMFRTNNHFFYLAEIS